jgi:hypothetical protein
MSKASFTDRNGREWELSLDFPKVYAIKKKIGLEISNVETFGRNWVDLMQHDDKALDAVWLAASDKPKDSDFDSFLAGMDGERLDAARDALFAAVVKFSPPRQRKLIEKAHQRLMRGYSHAMKQAEQKIQAIGSEVDS